MEESQSTGFMKKVIIGIVVLVVIVGTGVALFTPSGDVSECQDTEKVSPLDVDAEASPF